MRAEAKVRGLVHDRLTQLQSTVRAMEPETGFISTQPSMAEFLTALPHINESTFHATSSITPGPGLASTSAAGVPLPVAVSTATAPTLLSVSGDAPLSPSPEPNTPGGQGQEQQFPWMKEKKTARKQQPHPGKKCKSIELHPLFIH